MLQTSWLWGQNHVGLVFNADVRNVASAGNASMYDCIAVPSKIPFSIREDHYFNLQRQRLDTLLGFSYLFLCSLCLLFIGSVFHCHSCQVLHPSLWTNGIWKNNSREGGGTGLTLCPTLHRFPFSPTSWHFTTVRIFVNQGQQFSNTASATWSRNKGQEKGQLVSTMNTLDPTWLLRQLPNCEKPRCILSFAY